MQSLGVGEGKTFLSSGYKGSFFLPNRNPGQPTEGRNLQSAQLRGMAAHSVPGGQQASLNLPDVRKELFEYCQLPMAGAGAPLPPEAIL